MADIAIRVIRPLTVSCERVEVGTRLQLPALAAGELLASGRAALVNAGDAAIVLEATRKQAERVVAAAERANRERRQ